MIESMEATIQLTPAAVTKVKSILEERAMPDYGLRVFVSGGGCSGLQYGLALENTALDVDTVMDIEGVKIFVDSNSSSYVTGAIIDYVDSITGGGFQIENPNMVSSCGCGKSSEEKNAGSCGSGGCHCG